MIKKKIKPLLPSLREKKRYLAFEVLSEGKISDINDVSDAILGSSEEFLGQLGMSKAGLMVLKDKYDPNMQKGIIRVNHKNVDNLRAALTMVNKIGKGEAIVKSIGVSGILKKAEKNYIAS
jgi:ribonuclease P/MRP protein subunit POP5|tara:strand:+ start:110 stop:472 length:363 start_codon:yes stop_codon:yes gene_type:complete